MSYSYDKFLRPITSSDKSIKILDNTNDIKYTIDPFVIINVAVTNNILRISLKSLKVILLDFSTSNEAKISLIRIQEQIDILTNKVPILIDKDIQNYIQSQIEQVGIIIGPTGPTGSTGPQGLTGSTGSADRYFATSSTTFQVPVVGEYVELSTQEDLAYSSAQSIVIYSDLPNLYNSDYEIDGTYFVGQIDYYDSETGDMSLVTTFSSGSGTYSFWYLNLSGMVSDNPGTSSSNVEQVIDVALSDLLVLITNNSLVKGAIYKISNCDSTLYGYNNTGITLFLHALESNRLYDLGTGIFYNPKYEDYPIWDSTKVYSIGDIVIWGGFIWENTGSYDQPAIDVLNLDPTDWVKNYDESFYNISYDEIRYDISKDRITYRNEENINIVSNNYNNLVYFEEILGFRPISVFQWGRISNVYNQVITNSYNENINIVGNQFNLVFNNLSYQSNIVCSGTQSNLTFDNSSYQTNISIDESGYQNNLFFDSSYQTNINMSNGSHQDLIKLDNSYQNDILLNNDSHLHNIHLINSSYQTVLYLDNSVQEDIDLSNSFQSNITLLNGSRQTNFSFDNSSQLNIILDNNIQDLLNMILSQQNNLRESSGHIQENLVFTNYTFDRTIDPIITSEIGVSYIGNLTQDNSAPYLIGKLNNQLVEVDVTSFVSGSIGPQGPTGSQGVQGPIGPTGPDGLQGPIGPIGPTGPDGLQGATGATGPQGIQGVTGSNGIITSLNFTQSNANSISGVTTTGTIIVSSTITSTGLPIQLIATGDANPTSTTGQWCQLQLYRNSTAIGKIVQAESSAQNENIPYALNFIDTPGVGTFTYSVRPVTINGTWQFGEVTGNHLTIVELGGVQGLTGPQGTQGIQGVTGSQGTTGATGPQGIQGATGSQGIQGATGPADNTIKRYAYWAPYISTDPSGMGATYIAPNATNDGENGIQLTNTNTGGQNGLINWSSSSIDWTKDFRMSAVVYLSTYPTGTVGDGFVLYAGTTAAVNTVYANSADNGLKFRLFTYDGVAAPHQSGASFWLGTTKSTQGKTGNSDFLGIWARYTVEVCNDRVSNKRMAYAYFQNDINYGGKWPLAAMDVTSWVPTGNNFGFYCSTGAARSSQYISTILFEAL